MTARSTVGQPVPSGPSAPTGQQGQPSGEPVEPEALVVSHWFDSGEGGEPYSATIRLTGRRVGIEGPPRRGDTFTQDDRVDDIVPGSGPISVTTWVYGLQPGEWDVRAELIGRPAQAAGITSARDERRSRPEPLQPAAWSWRHWSLAPAPAAPRKTRWAPLAPLARTPGVIPGSYTALAVVGIIVGLAVQVAILERARISVPEALAVSLFALAIGLVGAKLWHAFLHPGPWRQVFLGGWSVDGFLVAAPVVGVATLAVVGLPIGTYLDSVTPGLFIAVMIGRVGCFFTGCCAGRCTRSRWGIWSSDRRIGARRIPTQLMESATGLVLAVVTTALVLADVPGVHGVIFVAAFAAYLGVRQLLLRLRAESRRFSWRRSSAAVSAKS